MPSFGTLRSCAESILKLDIVPGAVETCPSEVLYRRNSQHLPPLQEILQMTSRCTKQKCIISIDHISQITSMVCARCWVAQVGNSFVHQHCHHNNEKQGLSVHPCDMPEFLATTCMDNRYWRAPRADLAPSSAESVVATQMSWPY